MNNNVTEKQINLLNQLLASLPEHDLEGLPRIEQLIRKYSEDIIARLERLTSLFNKPENKQQDSVYLFPRFQDSKIETDSADPTAEYEFHPMHSHRVLDIRFIEGSRIANGQMRSVLHNAGYVYLGDILASNEKKLLKIYKFKQLSLDRVKYYLERHNLKLGSLDKNWRIKAGIDE